MNNIERIKIAIKKAKKIHNNKYDYSLVNYKRQQEKVIINCLIHGEFKQAFHSHLSGTGCPKCGNESMRLNNSYNYKYLNKRFIKKAEKIHNNKYDYSLVNYKDKNTKDKVIIICKKHGKFEQTYGNHITLKHNCPKCVLEKQYLKEKYIKRDGTIKKRRLNFLKISKKIHNSEYKYPYIKKEFKKYTSIVTVLCPKCGPIKQIAHNHMKGHGCKYCKISFIERKIYYWIKKILPENIEIIRNSRKIISNELDLYIPEYKLAIEYNGVYWHSIEILKYKYYHSNKQKECEKLGIKLITIFDVDYKDINKRKIIKSRIRSFLNLTKKIIYARKCEIKEINGKKSRYFLNKNHLQGYSPSSINIGLYYENKLSALMTFGKPRFNKKYEYELIRFTCKRNITILGGMSKLFSYFVKTYNPNSVITYSDLKWGTGKSYENLKFKFLKRTEPSAWYTHVSGEYKFYHRTKMQKHKLNKILKNYDSKLTAEENLVNHNFITIYDCGTNVYEYIKNN